MTITEVCHYILDTFLRASVDLELNYFLLRWYKFMKSNNNKKIVKLDERVKQVGGTLIIKEARVDDSGKYLCMVNNSVGGESVETVLTVTGFSIGRCISVCTLAVLTIT